MLKFKKIKKKNLSLIGLMGSGKSIIGKKLSNIYNMKYFDTDNEIENITKSSIEKIFNDYGENYFREIEEKICLDILKKNNCIISLGGGSILNPKIRKLIKNNSLSIFLSVNTEILNNRLKLSYRRPLLKKTNIKKKLDELLKIRDKYYNFADIIVENNFEKSETIEKIKSKINLYE